jgi:ferritin-like metal-binding protein YciE
VVFTTQENKKHSPELKSAFTEHLEQTKEQLQRLNQIGEKLGKSLGGHTCAAMKGLIEERAEWMEEDADEKLTTLAQSITVEAKA